MAIAEARVVWQRTVNRCFVQEDAKRAPKLACCQSSSKLIDPGLANADHPAVVAMPLNRSPSNTNVSPDTRWWLQPQPGYGYPGGLTSERVSTMDTEIEMLISGTFSSSCKFCGAQLEKEIHGNIADHNFQVNCKGIGIGVKDDSDFGTTGLKALHCKTTREHICEGMKEHYGIADMDPDKFTSKHTEELCFRSEASWIVCEKTEPWWRMTGRNELASFVAQKSLDCVENCDLPRPQKYLKRDSSACVGCAECDDKWPSSLGCKGSTYGHSCPVMYRPATRSMRENGRLCTSSEDNNLDKLFSSSSTSEDTVDAQKVFEGDPSKAQLLDALRHSQTRAREAEKAAKQARAETEHVVKLFFREATQLFAYKQWIQLLELEAAYGRQKNNGQKISYEARKFEGGQKTTREMQGTGSRPTHDITEFALAFAFGLSLVGAGLILGWTVGWMLCSF